jgi:thiol-disulfide isomerase/thioredoxin
MQLSIMTNNVLHCVIAAIILVGCASCSQSKDEVALPASIDIQSIDANDLNAWMANQKGKAILVDYWATWCVPCVEKFPKIIALEEKHRDQGLVVVAVNMNEQTDVATVSKFLNLHKPPFEQKMAIGKSSEAFENFNLDSLPTYRIHRLNGEVVHLFDGSSEFAEIETSIIELLK